MAVQLLLIAVQIAASYVLSRMSQPDGPRIKDLTAASGEYGLPMPRAYGEKVRTTGIFIAQADIDEDEHKIQDGSALFGAVGIAIPNPKYYTYSVTLAHLLADRTNDDPIEGLDKVWANGKLIFNAATATVDDEEFDVDGRLIWRKWKKNKFFKNLRLYTGHTDQPLNDELAGQQEISETSAYPFTAYVVIEDLELEKFGNGIPTLEYLFTVKTGQSFADAAELICAAGGIDHLRDISTTALADKFPRGILINEESSCWDALKPLLPVFGVDAAEVSGQIRFYKRSQFMRSVITTADMGSYAFGDSPPERYQFKRGTDVTLPQQTALTFIDPDRDYQSNTATAARTEGNAKSNVNIQVPVVMTADEAASSAALMHWDAWLGRTSVSFTLTDAWISLAVGYAYGISVAGSVIPYRVTRRVRGANGIMEIEAQSDESVSYTANIPGDSGLPPDEPSTEFADTRLILMDMPILDDGHDDYGFYIVVGETEPDWPRARIEASEDDITYSLIIDTSDRAVMGDVTGTLAAGTTTGLDDTLDTTSVLTVVLLHDQMTLESATDAQLDGGKNLAFVGKDGLGEYLQFKTATFVSGSTWQLTNLRRGRKGTDFAIGTHASGEVFALVDGQGVIRAGPSEVAEWGENFFFRGVTFGQDEADADVTEFENSGEGKRPYSPVNVEGTWDGSNNLTITWDSRSRLFAGGLGIDDNFEFDIEIISGTGRSDTVTVETFVYSAANQITDGITPGDSIQGRVRQTSDVNDGRWRDFLLLGPDDTWELEDDLTPIHLEDGTTPLGLEA